MNDLGISKSPQLISSDLICCEQDGVSLIVFGSFFTRCLAFVFGVRCAIILFWCWFSLWTLLWFKDPALPGYKTASLIANRRLFYCSLFQTNRKQNFWYMWVFRFRFSSYTVWFCCTLQLEETRQEENIIHSV